MGTGESPINLPWQHGAGKAIFQPSFGPSQLGTSTDSPKNQQGERGILDGGVLKKAVAESVSSKR